MITEERLESMIVQLVLAINYEFDLTAKQKKYIKSISIKRSGQNFVVSFWYGKRFRTTPKVITTK